MSCTRRPSSRRPLTASISSTCHVASTTWRLPATGKSRQVLEPLEPDTSTPCYQVVGSRRHTRRVVSNGEGSEGGGRNYSVAAGGEGLAVFGQAVTGGGCTIPGPPHTAHCHQRPRPPEYSVSPLSASCSGNVIYVICEIYRIGNVFDVCMRFKLKITCVGFIFHFRFPEVPRGRRRR